MIFAPALSVWVGIALLFSSCGEPIAESFSKSREAVPVFERTEIIAPTQFTDPSRPALKVMTWNIKYGAARIDFWFDFWGDRVQMTPTEVQTNLNAIYTLIREADPDLLLVQEIEVNSRRSAYTNMVTGILENTNLNYAAYFQTWNSRYVPSEGLGRVDLGNAIFSKHPVLEAERIPQADRTDLGMLERTFYLHRAVGRMKIQAGTREAIVFVVHTEAYDQDQTKIKHIDQIYDLMSTEENAGTHFVVGGDFNELPPTAVKRSDFLDERASAVGSDFEQPAYTPEVMQKFYDSYLSAISLERIGTTEESQKLYYTHSVLGPDSVNDEGTPGNWNRTLDYLFIRKSDTWRDGSTDVLQTVGRLGIQSDPLRLSDHAPMIGIWEIGE